MECLLLVFDNTAMTTVNKIQLESAKVFYREAGRKDSPTILLLHGYPTSSYMFRDLIPLLSKKFHVVAPDFPGFGFTEVGVDYEINFANIADTVNEFVQALSVEKFYLYVFDYGSPVGFRLALKNPSRISGIITQNGNAYDEGLDELFWGPLKGYWKSNEDNSEYVGALSKFIDDPANVVSQYFDGVGNIDAVDPAAYTLDIALLSRPGQTLVQLKLFYNYRTNVELYGKFQQFIRDSGVPVLVVWGKHDRIFTVLGAEAYKRDAKKIRIQYFETGHFALETHATEIAEEIISYFGAERL